MSHGMHDDLDGVGAQEFWEGHYRGRDAVWSGRPNAVLVRLVQSLAPGRALDLGSGEGGDAVWLAARGWQVTAVDVSATALERGARAARDADGPEGGLSRRITWEQHDLGRTFPDGTFDLVSAQYLHSPVDFPRAQVLRLAARAVAPGGTLLVVGHAADSSWSWGHHDLHHDVPQEVLASLELPPGTWRTDVLERASRPATGPQGQAGSMTDSVVALTRLAPAG